MRVEIWLIRHGETEWSRSGRHTGREDLPLTENGRRDAMRLASFLGEKRFALVLTSPLQRARETCRLAGFADVAVVEPDLAEWNYGLFGGRTSTEIRSEIPGWSIWNTHVPEGEQLSDVAARADGILAKVTKAEGPVALFSHGHMLRILTARWLGLPPQDGRLFALEAGAVSVLGYEHENRVIRTWNRVVE